MRASKFFVSTLKEAPSEAELISHQLMLRAGLIRRLAAGIYSWLPMGVRILRKVEAIVREEMNRAGAIEILLPVVQPGELWQESGRWEKYGQELLRFKDRHERDFVVQPTSEEVMTDIGRALLKSHKQLPVHYYQIQTKFRDERRPRFGVMRSREFIMKDGYSFHIDHADLEREYRNMYDTYTRIFTRLGLKFRAVAADNGAIGGTGSHEFQVLADSGEDAIAYCPDSDYAANVEAAEALAPATPRKAAGVAMKKVPTPGKKTCEDVVELLKLPLSQSVKALMLEHDGKLFMLLVRGDHSLNEIKASKIPGLSPFRFANESEIVTATGSPPGYIGPLGVKQVMVIADRSVAAMADFVCGANEEGFHLTGVNWGRDLPEPDLVADIRNVLAGDASPDGKGKLEICRGIEVGQVFQLRTVYSVPMKATVLDEAGQPRPMEMGCYGIGVTRIVGAAIEQGHDERGIVFPAAIAPFELAIVPIGMKKSEAGKQATEDLYAKAQAAGIDVFLDDRDERPGVMFAEMELLGIPHRIVVGDRGLKEGKLEYQGRTDTAATAVALDDAIGLVKQKLGAA